MSNNESPFVSLIVGFFVLLSHYLVSILVLISLGIFIPYALYYPNSNHFIARAGLTTETFFAIYLIIIVLIVVGSLFGREQQSKDAVVVKRKLRMDD